MDLLEDLGFALDLEECDISEEGAAADPESTDVLAAARRFQSGRSAAQQAYGDGKWRVGAGPMRLDWRCCVERMLSTTSLAEREECVRALGTLAQVALHGDAMREAGVVGGVTSLLSDPHEPVAIAAAEALRHLACANQQNREAAREAGAIPLLIAMLERVAAARAIGHLPAHRQQPRPAGL